MAMVDRSRHPDDAVQILPGHTRRAIHQSLSGMQWPMPLRLAFPLAFRIIPGVAPRAEPDANHMRHPNLTTAADRGPRYVGRVVVVHQMPCRFLHSHE